MEIILNTDLLNVRYGAFRAVSDVSFSVQKGKILGIVGESGSGKSTLALAIAHLLPPTAAVSGQIRFGPAQQILTLQTIAPLRGKSIGMVFQEASAALNPLMTCGRQIEENIQQHLNLPAKEVAALALEWLQKVKIDDPERAFRSYPWQLSGGQQQRVMMAIALCCRPSLLIADEPTTALDVTVQKSILDLLKEMQAELDLTILFISHDINVVRYMADDVAIMQAGKIVDFGPVNHLLSNPSNPYTIQITQAKKVLEQGRSQDYSSSNEILFEKEKITVQYPLQKSFLGRPRAWLTAVNQVDIQIRKGECLGIVGESGSGKSTLGREVARLMGGAKGGAVIIDQHPQSALNPMLRVGDAIAEVLTVYGFASNKKSAREQTLRLLADVELDESFYDRYPQEMSGGQKQRVCIARALAAKPQLLICDEIVSALDMTVQAAVLELLKNLQEEKQLSLLFISHNLQVVRYLCHTTLVLDSGNCVEKGSTEQIWGTPQTAYTLKFLRSSNI